MDWKILYANIRSLRNKVEEVELMIREIGNIDIVVLVETWIREEETDFYNIQGYTSVHSCRNSTKRGGGTAIYIRNNITFTTESTTEPIYEEYNVLTTTIQDMDPKLKIVAYYKPPNANRDQFLEALDSILAKSKHSLLISDTNIDLLNEDENTRKYLEILTTNNASVLNIIDSKNATRESNHRSSIIDHVVTTLSKERYGFGLEIRDWPNLDHRIIIIKFRKDLSKRARMSKREIVRINRETFRHKVKNAVEEHDDLNFDQLIHIIKTAKLEATETKVIRTRENNWITSGIIKKIKERNKLYKRMKRNPNSPQLKQYYKKLKNEITWDVRRTKKEYVERKLGKAGNDTKKMWKIINETIRNSTLEDRKKSIEELNIDGTNIHDKQQIANHMNRHFVNIGPSLVKKLQERGSHLHEPTKNYTRPNTIFVRPVNTDEVESVIMQLNQDSAPGLDGITIENVKDIKEIILEPLTKMINKCIDKAEFPKCLKTACIVPIFKDGDRKNPNNYRPIALLNVFSKVYERLLHNQLTGFIQENGGFDKKQYGFQRLSNTTAIMTDVMEYINKELDAGKCVIGVFVDLKKAFDTVDHNILIEILGDLGIRGKANELLCNYLQERQCCTKVENNYSDKEVMRTGVPQGSILGPLLYSLYIQNIVETGLSAEHYIYADDTLLLYAGKIAATLQNKINEDLIRYTKWLYGNKLTINTSKTNYMIFQQKGKQQLDIELKIEGEPIKRVDTVKYLGVIIDDKLSWTEHTIYVRKRVAPLIGIMRRRDYLNYPSKVLIYNAFILPIITYNIINWSQCKNNQLNSMHRLMNKAIKSIFNLHRLTSTAVLYEATKFLSLKQLIYVEKAKMIHKIKNNMIKSNINLVEHGEIHNHGTRSRQHIRLSYARTNRKLKSLKNTAVPIYNGLPEEIKKTEQMHRFKKLIKNFAQENVPIV